MRSVLYVPSIKVHSNFLPMNALNSKHTLQGEALEEDSVSNMKCMLAVRDDVFGICITVQKTLQYRPMRLHILIRHRYMHVMQPTYTTCTLK